MSVKKLKIKRKKLIRQKLIRRKMLPTIKKEKMLINCMRFLIVIQL